MDWIFENPIHEHPYFYYAETHYPKDILYLF